MSYGRMSRFPSYNIAKIAAVIITFIVIIVVMIESVVIVEAGHRGVVLYLGAVENRVLGEGLHFIVHNHRGLQLVRVSKSSINIPVLAS
jgi:regulator of protease activity HflC (stomatin/prohibitin superfamily)